MIRILVHCHGYIGDILFASSVAERLHAKYGNDVIVDYYIPLPQPVLLLQENPYINRVYVTPDFDRHMYDDVKYMGVIDQGRPATVQFQEMAGITDTRIPFYVYTLPELDARAQEYLSAYRATAKPLVAWQLNWAERAHVFTREHYEHPEGMDALIWAGVYNPPERDVARIVAALESDMVLIPVGLSREFHQRTEPALDHLNYARTASIIKHCDFQIGAEGGITNLSAGVGTRTIITTDFMVRLYGPHGSVKPHPTLQMGPLTYHPNGGHVHLDPFLDDDQVIDQIRATVLSTVYN